MLIKQKSILKNKEVNFPVHKYVLINDSVKKGLRVLFSV